MFHVIEIFQNNFLEKMYTVRTPCYFHLKSFIITIKEHSFEMPLDNFTKTAIRTVLSSSYKNLVNFKNFNSLFLSRITHFIKIIFFEIISKMDFIIFYMK